jgi:HAD domain in Swiss Army Knife RNA repair proteins
MKIIFLDIDGVIALPVPGRKTVLPSRQCIEQLNRITDATGAKIVLTSGRRFATDNESTLAEWGVRGEIIGRTPLVGNGLGGNRAEDIAQWLTEYQEPIEKFVILDDDWDVGELCLRLIRTDWNDGLTIALAEEAIRNLT